MKPTRSHPAAPAVPRLPLSVWLTYLLVCTLLFTGVSFSRYSTSADGTDTARTAAGRIEVQCSQDTTLALDADTQEAFLVFSVSNPGAEVAIRYDVEVKLDEPLPAGVTLTLDDNSSQPEADNRYLFSQVGCFAPGTPDTQSHTLKVTANFDECTTAGTQEIPVTISVCAEQID